MIMFMTWILSALLIVTSQTGLSDADPIYGKVGGSIDLNPGPISETIQSATWKHNADLAVEWFGQELVSYRTFEGRCAFNKTSGSLTINNLTLDDRGSYTPEINNKVLQMKELQVIKPVPIPTVSIKCNEEKTSCSLTCEAQVSAGFGPVTYKWKTGDTDFSTDKEPLITTENKESSFFCELVNPVSSSSSETVENPLIADNHAVAVAVPVILLLVVAVIVAAVLYKRGHLPRLTEFLNGRKKTNGGDAEAGEGLLEEQRTTTGEGDVEAGPNGVPVTECRSLLNSINTDADGSEIKGTKGKPLQPEQDVDQKPTSETMDGNLDERSSTTDIYELCRTEPEMNNSGSMETSNGASSPTISAVSIKNDGNHQQTSDPVVKKQVQVPSSPLSLPLSSNGSYAEKKPVGGIQNPLSTPSDSTQPNNNKSAVDQKPDSEPIDGNLNQRAPTPEIFELAPAPEEKTEETKEKTGSSDAAGSVDMESKGEINNSGSNGKFYKDEKESATSTQEEGDPLLTDTNTVTADGSGIKGTKGKPKSNQTAGSADMQREKDAKKKPVDEIQGQKSTPPDSSQPNINKSDEGLQQASDPADNNQVQIPASPTSIQLNSKKSDEDHQQALGPADNNKIQKTASPISFQPNSNKSDEDLQQASDPADNNQVQIPASPTSVQPNSNKSDGDHQQSTDSVDKWKGQTSIPPFSYQQKGNESDNSSLKQSGEKTPDQGSEDEEQS